MFKDMTLEKLEFKVKQGRICKTWLSFMLVGQDRKGQMAFKAFFKIPTIMRLVVKVGEVNWTSGPLFILGCAS